MSQEGQLIDLKSLPAVTSKTADWKEIAKDCIAFANATGGCLMLGIEDGQDTPPTDQRIPSDLPNTLKRKMSSKGGGTWYTLSLTLIWFKIGAICPT